MVEIGPATPSRSRESHFLTLDGLRGLAALAVLYFHRRKVAPETWHIFDHGYLAVDFFFILSGFVIAHAYAARLRSDMSFQDFLIRRAIRLYPMTILSVIAGGALLLVENKADASLAATTAANIFLIPFRDSTLTPAYLSEIYFPTNPPLYSLFFELIINLAFAFAVKTLTPTRVLIIVAISFVALLGALNAMTLAAMGQHPSFALFFASGLARTSFSFFLGVALFEHRHRLPKTQVHPLLIAAAALSVFLVYKMPGAWNEVFNLAAVTLAFPIIIQLGSANEPNGHAARFAALLGALSYPVYALHVPLYGWYDQFHMLRYRASLLTAVVFVVAVAYSALRFYDEPVRHALDGRRRRMLPTRKNPATQS